MFTIGSVDLFGAPAKSIGREQDASERVMSEPSPAVCSMSTAATAYRSSVQTEGEASGTARCLAAAAVDADEPRAAPSRKAAALEPMEDLAVTLDARQGELERVRSYPAFILRVRAHLCFPPSSCYFSAASCTASEHPHPLLLGAALGHSYQQAFLQQPQLSVPFQGHVSSSVLGTPNPT